MTQPAGFWKDLRHRLSMHFTVQDVMGIPFNSRSVYCPIHQHHRSGKRDVSIHASNRAWRCWGRCSHERWLSIFDYIMIRDNCSYRDSVKYLAERAGIAITMDHERTRILQQYHQETQAAMYEDEDNPAWEYLRSRGLEHAVGPLALGWSETGYVQNLTNGELHSVGLATHSEDRYYPMLRNRVVFPIYSNGGILHQLQGRSVEASPNVKYLALSGNVERRGPSIFECVGHEQGLFQQQEAFILEGWPDMATFYTLGIQNVSNIFGHVGLAKQHWRFRRLKRLYNFFDNDAASQTDLWKQLLELHFLNRDLELKRCLLPEGSDVNEVARQQTPPGHQFTPRDNNVREYFLTLAEQSTPFIEDLITWKAEDVHLHPFILAAILHSSGDQERYFKMMSSQVGESIRTLRYAASLLNIEQQVGELRWELEGEDLNDAPSCGG